MMKLNTERMTLRTFQQQDLKDVFDFYKDKAVCNYLLHEPWDERNSAELFNKLLNNNELTEEKQLNIACELEGKVIGDVSVWYTGMKETVEIGFVFNPTYSGKGYANEAVKHIIDYIFSEHPIHRIQAVLDARNLGSAKLCERVAMRQEAHFIQDYWSKGEWTDSYVYGILASEHEASK